MTTRNMTSNVTGEEIHSDEMEVREMMRRMQKQMEDMQNKYKKDLRELRVENEARKEQAKFSAINPKYVCDANPRATDRYRS